MADGAALLRDYRAAKTVMDTVPRDTMIYREAERIVAVFGRHNVTFKFKCMLCNADLEHEMSMEEAAELQDTPRGVCGRCA